MTTLGDVWAVLTAILGICLSSWAVLLGFASLFPRRTTIAQHCIDRNAWLPILTGLTVWLVLGTLGLAMLGAPNPLAKIGGTLVLAVLIGLTSLGTSGLAQLIAARLRVMDPKLSEYQALCRASAIVVLSGLLPIVGWFAIVPLTMAAGLGAGMRAAFRRPADALAPQFEIGG